MTTAGRGGAEDAARAVELPEASELGARLAAATALSYVGFTASFVSSVVVARLLGPEGKGLFSLVLATAGALVSAATLGLPHGQMYHVSRNRDNLRHFMPNGRIAALFLGGGVALGYFAVGWFARIETVIVLDRVTVMATIALVPLNIILIYQGQYFLLSQRYVLAKATVVLGTAALPLALYLLLYATQRVSVGNFVGAYVGSHLVALLVFGAVRSRGRSIRETPSARLALRSISFGIRQFASDLALFLALRLDYFLVVLYVGKAGLGIYSVAMGLAEVTSRLSNEIGTMLFPAFASGRLDRGGAVPVLRLVVFLSIGIAIALSVLSAPIVRVLYGSDYAAAILPFRILLVGTVAWSTIHVTWTYTAASGSPGIGVLIFGSAAAIDAVLNVVLLPRIGILGAAIASTVSYAAAALVFLSLFARRQDSTVGQALKLRRSDLRLAGSAGRKVAEKLAFFARRDHE